MKKSLLILLLVSYYVCSSQTLSYNRTYTLGPTTITNNQFVVASAIQANVLYNVYMAGNMGRMIFQKNDLNGTPVLAKSYPITFNVFEINFSNGFMYVSGDMPGANVLYMPYVAKLDTANLNLIYIKQLDVNATANTFVSDSKISSDGNLMMVGTTWLGGSPFGMIVGFDLANDNLAYSNTLTIAGGSTYVNGMTEISNSSVLFTGFNSSLGQRFIGRGIKTASTFSIDAIYHSPCGLDNVDLIPGSHRVLTYDRNNVYKVDTSLALLNAGTARTLNSFFNGHFRSYFIEDRIYRLGNYYEMDITDTSLNTIAYVSYSFALGTFTSGYQVDIGNGGWVTKNNSSLYIDYGPVGGKNTFSLIKTDLMGNLACSNTFSRSPNGDMTNTSSATSFNFGSRPCVITTTNAIGNSEIVTFSDDCFGTVSLRSEAPGRVHVKFDGEKYTFIAEDEIKAITISDLSGKTVRTLHFNDTQQATTYVDDLTKGMYIARIQFADNSYRQFKLLNY